MASQTEQQSFLAATQRDRTSLVGANGASKALTRRCARARTERRLRGRLVLAGRRSVPPSMFEGVRANGNSSNRLALHRAERSLYGVCDGDACKRQPP